MKGSTVLVLAIGLSAIVVSTTLPSPSAAQFPGLKDLQDKLKEMQDKIQDKMKDLPGAPNAPAAPNQSGAPSPSSAPAASPSNAASASPSSEAPHRTRGDVPRTHPSTDIQQAPAVGGANYVALRKAADKVAANIDPRLKLWRVDLEAWFHGNELRIQRGFFHYFIITGQLPTDHDWVSAKDVGLVAVEADNAAGMHLPQAHRTDSDQSVMVDKWQLKPVPANVRPPEELFAQLHRSFGHDPAHGAWRVRLIHVGDEIRTSPRYRRASIGNPDNLGMKPYEAQFFVKTAPHGPDTWIWWTVAEQNRTDPTAHRGAPGTPKPTLEFVYIDAINGAETSACRATTPSPIAC